MRRIVLAIGFAVIALASYSFGARAAGVAHAAAPQAIIGPNTTATCTINATEIDLLGDGSFVMALQCSLNNNPRVRHVAISADGTTFTLDGVAVATPPPALQALGTHLAAATAKITAAYSAVAVQNALCGP